MQKIRNCGKMEVTVICHNRTYAVTVVLWEVFGFGQIPCSRAHSNQKVEALTGVSLSAGRWALSFVFLFLDFQRTVP